MEIKFLMNHQKARKHGLFLCFMGLIFIGMNSKLLSGITHLVRLLETNCIFK